MRNRTMPGSRRLTPFKQGYLDAIEDKGHNHVFFGRKAIDYMHGYGNGIYTLTLRYLTNSPTVL